MPASEPEPVRGSEDLPLGLLIAASALLVAGLAGGWWALVRCRRRGPDPEPQVAVLAIAHQDTQGADVLGVEAALQELIAEEHARQMLAHPSHSERADAECGEFAAPP